MLSAVRSLSKATIFVGSNSVKELPTTLKKKSRRVLVVCRESTLQTKSAGWPLHILRSSGLQCSEYVVDNASPSTWGGLIRGIEMARTLNCDTVVAIGSAKVLDMGKMIASLAFEPKRVLHRIEEEAVVLDWKGEDPKKLAFVAMPTELSFGTESSNRALCIHEKNDELIYMHGDSLSPSFICIDPEICLPSDSTLLEARTATAQILSTAAFSNAAPQMLPFLDIIWNTNKEKVTFEDSASLCLAAGIALSCQNTLSVPHALALWISMRSNYAYSSLVSELFVAHLIYAHRIVRDNLDCDDIVGKTGVDCLLALKNLFGFAELKDTVDWVKSLCLNESLPSLNLSKSKMEHLITELTSQRLPINRWVDVNDEDILNLFD